MVRNDAVTIAAPGPRARPSATSRADTDLRERSATSRASCRDEPRDGDGAHERDEPGHEEEEQHGVATASEALLVERSLEEGESDHDQGGARRPLPAARDARRRAGAATRRAATRPGREQRRGDRDGEAGRGQGALAQHTPRGCVRDEGGHCAGRASDEPSENDAADRHERALDTCQHAELPRAGAVPGQTHVSRAHVTPKAPRREQREREQERRRLPADEEQPLGRDVGRALRGAELLLGGVDREPARDLRELGPRPLHLTEQRVDLPQPRAAGRDRPDPCIRAVDARERGRPGERLHPFGGDERGRRRPVIATGLPQRRCHLRVRGSLVGGREEVAEELPRDERRGPDLDEPDAGCVRKSALAAQPEHLTACRRTAPREPPRAQDHVLSEPVHARDPDEPPGDRALPEQHELGRARHGELGKRLLDLPVECGLRLGRGRRDSEPDRTHGALGGRHPLDLMRGRAVSRDRPTDDDAGQDRRGHGQPERREHRPAVPAAQAAPREPRDVPGRPHEPAAFRRRYAAVLARFPQIDIEHHTDERLRDPS